jgi:2,3-bisphosphoglycerate-independent phosphoglycerate mutase
VEELKGIAIVTADHGNVDEMIAYDKNGNKIPKTSHTLNPVPFVICDSQYKYEYRMAQLKKRGLSNIAATILNLLGYEKPEEYDPSLIEFRR